jgi:imidazolonepropionase-like amidohydrolase
MVVLLSGIGAVGAEQHEEAPPQILFTNVHIFDGSSEVLSESANVLIEGNLIKTISAEPIETNANAEVIDGGGRTLMPGLIDSHVHLLYSGTPDAIPDREAMRWDQLAAIGVVNARDFLMDGFTTVRDAGAMYDGIKKVIDQGLLPGPRIYPSGGVLSQTSGHADWRILSQRHPGLTGTQDNNLDVWG